MRIRQHATAFIHISHSISLDNRMSSSAGVQWILKRRTPKNLITRLNYSSVSSESNQDRTPSVKKTSRLAQIQKFRKAGSTFARTESFFPSLSCPGSASSKRRSNRYIAQYLWPGRNEFCKRVPIVWSSESTLDTSAQKRSASVTGLVRSRNPR